MTHVRKGTEIRSEFQEGATGGCLLVQKRVRWASRSRAEGICLALASSGSSIASATAEVEDHPKPVKAHPEARLTSPSNLLEPPTHVHCTDFSTMSFSGFRLCHQFDSVLGHIPPFCQRKDAAWRSVRWQIL